MFATSFGRIRARQLAVIALFVTSLAGALARLSAAAEPTGPDPQVYDNMVSRAVGYLRQSQLDDGSFSPQAGPAVTALVTNALLAQGRSADDPMVARALKYLEGFVHDDGGIYAEGTFHRTTKRWLPFPG
ncbi:MAG: hypothetical protein KDA63_06705 [Planctomycetales bacterium]|nr:hypothetical protein [Planctomycetales bacterium]